MRAGRAIGAGILVAAGVAGYRRRRAAKTRPVAAQRVVTVDKPAEELYRFWRSLANAPRFMKWVEEVEIRDERRSRWVATLPGRRGRIEWESEVLEDRPGELIAWRSVSGAPVRISGRVEFAAAPAGRGTEVRSRVETEGVPHHVLERHVAEDLRRFKRLLETGEIATVEGQPSGSRSALGKLVVGRRERSAP